MVFNYQSRRNYRVNIRWLALGQDFNALLSSSKYNGLDILQKKLLEIASLARNVHPPKQQRGRNSKWKFLSRSINFSRPSQLTGTPSKTLLCGFSHPPLPLSRSDPQMGRFFVAAKNWKFVQFRKSIATESASKVSAGKSCCLGLTAVLRTNMIFRLGRMWEQA